MDTDAHRWNQITEAIIGCVYRVSNELGCGFLEKVCENALAHELRKAGLSVEQQKPIIIHYDGVVVGQYAADLVVEGVVLLELKACKAFDEIHEAQCLNYLKATGLPICLLINFGRAKAEIKRFAGKSANFST
jgi:GxxExxY protein